MSAIRPVVNFLGYNYDYDYESAVTSDEYLFSLSNIGTKTALAKVESSQD